MRGALAAAYSDARHSPRVWHPSSGGAAPGASPEHAPVAQLGTSGDHHVHVRRQLGSYFDTLRQNSPPLWQSPPPPRHHSSRPLQHTSPPLHKQQDTQEVPGYSSASRTARGMHDSYSFGPSHTDDAGIQASYSDGGGSGAGALPSAVQVMQGYQQLASGLDGTLSSIDDVLAQVHGESAALRARMYG